MDIFPDFSLDLLLGKLCARGVQRGVAPVVGAGVLYYRNDKFFKSVNLIGYTGSDRPARHEVDQVFFDLASLTKPLCVATGLLLLVQEGLVRLEDTLETLYPKPLPADKRNISLSHLLGHSSGLPAYRPYFQTMRAQYGRAQRDMLLERIVREPLENSPGSACCYSDLGYILLGAVIEQVSNMEMDAFFTSRIARPLHVEQHVFFRPLGRAHWSDGSLFPATGFCPWRGRTMEGSVQDEHSWLLGGVSGHAGLFGSIEGVLALTGELLRSWREGTGGLAGLQPLLSRCLRKQQPDASWGLGFDTPSGNPSSSGRYLTPGSVGHLGYTGTSFWIDPVRCLVIVLLTNRLQFGRDNASIRLFRPWLHDTLVQWLDQERGTGERVRVN